jgi:hypothetical protein
MITKSELLKIVKEVLNEDTAGGIGGGAAGTTITSVGGAYEAPLMGISKRKWASRIATGYKKVGDEMQPIKEYVYSNEGKLVTGQDIEEWFGRDKSKKPSWNGGKIVDIEPKCLAFPYCNQGAVDKPIKLIGESKDTMCPHCYEYVSHIAEQTGKNPEYVAKLIRDKYLS